MTGKAPAPASELPDMLLALKRILHLRGIRYRDLAASLGKSETTIKRYLSGAGILPVQTMEQICRSAGIQLSELFELASQGHGAKRRRLTQEQETALGENAFLSFVFLLLRFSWTADRIQAEFDLEPARVVSALTRLDRLGLIELLPGNKVRLLVAHDLQADKDAVIVRSVGQWMKREFVKFDVDDPDAPWVRELVQLTQGQVGQMKELMGAFIRDVRRASRDSHAQPRSGAGWYGVFAAMQPLTLSAPSDDYYETLGVRPLKTRDIPA